MANLEFNKRDNTISNSAKKARRSGMVPGVLYGNKMKNMMFEVGELDLAREIACQGEHGILNFNLTGENHKALVKDVQRDPVSHKIIHLDLEELKGNQNIISSVPIHYVGEELLTKRGVVLQKEKDSVRVECSADSLPKYVEIKVNGGGVGSVYKFGDLEIASEISIVDDLNSVIASVSYERKTVADDMEVASEE
ncbi:50S ribosomal protein L25 [Clostridium septicum]|uniref:Large ribosomal subunit protein bL25 n=1 Tax=Clostridium septicum TaxID=1504 RepID=A0A9N7JPA2_CLOSE|nr:50S ribosomal protein L25 [Clostridium septicum]AYE35571.1 50S ribosomal protein L25 [Clostridium septicum]MDU1314994.1 50S ribosomal protein L25 [Clostridium septicum]QAS60957.1 50S ribosomal protein L25 [Clostridium septicum]UEC19765.1 50S ribosomal protein L25 [Clostridium septicum]USS02175.1 50S ribosomal protein L25 [Clostridium septicum]